MSRTISLNTTGSVDASTAPPGEGQHPAESEQERQRYRAQHDYQRRPRAEDQRGDNPPPAQLIYLQLHRIEKEYQRKSLGPQNVFMELQQNLVRGDTLRNRRLISLGEKLGVGVVATNNVHYHAPDRHRLHDALVAIRHNKSLEETHRERRPNGHFYLKSPDEMAALFRDVPRPSTTPCA